MKRFWIALSLCALFTAALLIPAQAQERSVYRGKTTQNRAIQVSASPSQIAPIRFKVRMLCRDGSLLFGDLSDFEPTRLTSSGRFSDRQYGHSDTVTWRGSLKGRKLSGTLRVKDRLSSGVRCDSGPVRFKAKRAGR